MINQNNGYGTFTFRDRETGLPGFARTGSGMASFLLGEVDNLNLGSPFDSWVASGALGFFGQDTWRVTPKLTLTYGLRWDYFFPTTEHNGKVGSFDPNLANPGAGRKIGSLDRLGRRTRPQRNYSVNDPYYGALGGQLGIAYSLDSKTVVRMNYGVGYASGWDKWTNGLTNNLPQPGFSATFTPSTVDEGVTPAFNWNDTIPVTFPQFPVTNPALLNGGTLGFINRADKKPPMYQNIGFEIGRELPGQLALRASYVATLVHRITANGADEHERPSSLCFESWQLAAGQYQLGRSACGRDCRSRTQASTAAWLKPYCHFRSTLVPRVWRRRLVTPRTMPFRSIYRSVLVLACHSWLPIRHQRTLQMRFKLSMARVA